MVAEASYNRAPRLEQARLIVLEGIDLSGRTTQVQLLWNWLLAQGYAVTTTALRTSPLISDVLERARSGSPLRPLTYSMLFCADHLDRTESVIKPALARGEIVLADRYIYTAFARDEARGLDPTWVRNLYRTALSPDAVFYLHISPDEAVKRRLVLQNASRTASDGKRKKRQKSTVSLPKVPSFTPETMESFRSFEKKMYDQYQRMQKEFNFSVIEGGQSIELVQTMLRRAVMHMLWKENI